MSRNTALFLILALSLGVAFLVARSVTAATGSSKVFHQWTLPNGDIMVTDDAARIPVKYQDIAVKRSFVQVDKDAKVTEMVIPSADYAAALEANLTRSRKLAARMATVPRAEECDGPITVAQERRDHEERGNSYNSLFYVVRDSCGNVKNVTRSTLHPYIKIE